MITKLGKTKNVIKAELPFAVNYHGFSEK